jgi:hypothetical protein
MASAEERMFGVQRSLSHTPEADTCDVHVMCFGGLCWTEPQSWRNYVRYKEGFRAKRLVFLIGWKSSAKLKGDCHTWKEDFAKD